MGVEKVQLFVNLTGFLCTALGFGYGAFRFFRKKKALYLQMIVCALGCMMLGRLFQVVMLLTAGAIPDGFYVGRLGVIGSFLFFFTANYGQMDSLVDDKSKQFLKYRILALLAPVVILLGYVPIWFHTSNLPIRVTCAFLTAVIMMASYYNFKHLIMPDVDLGIIAVIRGYNLLALLFALLSMAEMTLTLMASTTWMLLIGVMNGIVALLLIPVLERGVKRWTI